MTKLIEALSAIAGAHQILENEPMSRHTTFKVGGPADVLFLPESEEQLIQAIAIAKDAGIPCIVIGNGSNLGRAWRPSFAAAIPSPPGPAPPWRGFLPLPRPVDWRGWSSPRAYPVRWAAAAR